jgi:hypothetical protein
VLPSSLPLFLASIDAERIVNGHLGGDKQIGGVVTIELSSPLPLNMVGRPLL